MIMVVNEDRINVSDIMPQAIVEDFMRSINGDACAPNLEKP